MHCFTSPFRTKIRLRRTNQSNKGGKHYEKWISVILVITLVTMISGIVTAVEAGEDAAPVMFTSSGEEKVYCNATVEHDFAENRVMVVLSNEASLAFNTYETADFGEIGCAGVQDLSQASGRKIQAKAEALKTAVVSSGADVDTLDTYGIDAYNQVLCIELAESGKENVLAAIDELIARDDVIYAGPDYVMHMYTAISPGDQFFSLQTAVPVIQLQEAWGITTGSSNVIVAVIDSGINSYHVDLDDNVNGSLSMDFSNGDSIADPYPTDNGDHGTHVAGIIGAEGGNGNGIAGVCWDVQLVSLKVFRNGTGYSSYVQNAIQYADSHDIPIINFSGGYFSGNSTINYYDQSLYESIDNYSGLFVCAAGNDNANIDACATYPSSYVLENLITVGNSTDSDGLGLNSNYGKISVDLFAPGENVYSTWLNNGYASKSGTSMAAPYVTGVAALILSVYPDLLPCEVKDTILSNVDDCGSAFDDMCVSGGRLNAYKALTNVKRHSLNYTDSEIDSKHIIVCASCGCEGMRPHDYDNISYLNILKHKISCDCGAYVLESHTWNVTKTRCLSCGYSLEGPVEYQVYFKKTGLTV